MRQDLTHVLLIVDHSWSMKKCQQDAQDGINAFINDQKDDEGETVVTIIEFDDSVDYVCKAAPIKEVPEYILTPRGNTALVAAVTMGITDLGKVLADTAEANRPGLVIVVIATDGEENSSRKINPEYTKAALAALVDEQEEKYKWQFTFLGANIDAFGEAGGIGITGQTVAAYSVANTSHAFAAATSNVKRMKSASIRGAKVESFYTDQERSMMSGDPEPDDGLQFTDVSSDVKNK